MVPERVVVDVISQIYEDESEHYLLSDENFPYLNDLFWSIGYHYTLMKCFRANNLMELLHEVCPKKKWNSILGLAGGVGKGNRGNY